MDCGKRSYLQISQFTRGEGRKVQSQYHTVSYSSSAVQYSECTVLYHAHCCTLCTAVLQYSILQYSTLHYTTLHHRTMQYQYHPVHSVWGSTRHSDDLLLVSQPSTPETLVAASTKLPDKNNTTTHLHTEQHTSHVTALPLLYTVSILCTILAIPLYNAKGPAHTAKPALSTDCSHMSWPASLARGRPGLDSSLDSLLQQAATVAS